MMTLALVFTMILSCLYGSTGDPLNLEHDFQPHQPLIGRESPPPPYTAEEARPPYPGSTTYQSTGYTLPLTTSEAPSQPPPYTTKGTLPSHLQSVGCPPLITPPTRRSLLPSTLPNTTHPYAPDEHRQQWVRCRVVINTVLCLSIAAVVVGVLAYLWSSGKL